MRGKGAEINECYTSALSQSRDPTANLTVGNKLGLAQDVTVASWSGGMLRLLQRLKNYTVYHFR